MNMNLGKTGDIQEAINLFYGLCIREAEIFGKLAFIKGDHPMFQ